MLERLRVPTSRFRDPEVVEGERGAARVEGITPEPAARRSYEENAS